MKIDKEFQKLIPPLHPEELKQLETKILREGFNYLRYGKIITWQDTIIDGHNRYDICQKHNIECCNEEIDQAELLDREAVKDWIDENQLGKRNLTDDQRKIIIGRRYNREKKAAHGRADRHFSGDQIDTPKTADRLADEYKVSAPTVKRYAKDAEYFEQLQTEKADVADKIWSGEYTITEAKKEEKNTKRQEELKHIEEKIKTTPIEPCNTPFDVVILDPPWNYGREYDASSSRVANPYPEQTIEEIYNDVVAKINFNQDCVLWLWTTHRFIFDAKSLLEKWGFEYKATVVWDKESMGMGSWVRMQCEFCLMGIKGKPFINLSNQRDMIREKRREHSRKPVAFYDLVKSLTPGVIGEYHSRELKDGIITIGIENGKLGK